MNYFPIKLGNLDRQLPLCKVTDDLYIGAFVIFGDPELTVECAKELLKKAPEHDYIITAEYKGCKVSNKITVLPVLSAEDLTKKYGGPEQFITTLVDGQGKPYEGQTVTFNINGIFYKRTTDENGVASGYFPKDTYTGSLVIPAGYKANTSFQGATVGRYANRINQGKIVLDGEEIQLPQNNYGHCLHGGPTGWQNQVFKAIQKDDKTIVLTIESPDGDNNFPGNVIANVTYTLTDNNAIDIM